jgi:hypothetical protein
MAPDRAGSSHQALLTHRLLAPWDGARYRHMSLNLDGDGGVTLRFHEMGAGDAAPWGADDEEITVRLDPRATTRLAFEMLAEILNSREDGLRELVALCGRYGLDPVVARWT